MKAYFDTSYLVALYVPNDHTSAALRHRSRNEQLPLPFNPLHRLELRTTVRQCAYAGLISEADARRILRHVEEDLDDGTLAHAALEWTDSLRMTTAFGHLPTGGNSSTIISFFAFKPMFDEIYSLATGRELVMSCCVDDMTFSGTAATDGFLNEVRVIVQRFGLKTHKRHCFEPHQTKIVTGVALTPQGIRLPNARRKKLHEAVEAFDVEPNIAKKVKLGEQLLGRTTEAAQVEEKFRPLIRDAATKLQEAKKGLVREFRKQA